MSLNISEKSEILNPFNGYLHCRSLDVWCCLEIIPEYFHLSIQVKWIEVILTLSTDICDMNLFSSQNSLIDIVYEVLCNFATNSFNQTLHKYILTNLLCARHCLLPCFKQFSLAPPERFLTNGEKSIFQMRFKSMVAVVKTSNKGVITMIKYKIE